MKTRTKVIAATGALALLPLLAGCPSQANIAGSNISKEAEEFRVDRRIVAVNLITDKYLFQVTGKCSIETNEVKNRLELTCKIGPEAFVKQYIGYTPGAQVAYTIEQLKTVNVDSYRYELILRPQSVVPIVIG